MLVMIEARHLVPHGGRWHVWVWVPLELQRLGLFEGRRYLKRTTRVRVVRAPDGEPTVESRAEAARASLLIVQELQQEIADAGRAKAFVRRHPVTGEVVFHTDGMDAITSVDEPPAEPPKPKCALRDLYTIWFREANPANYVAAAYRREIETLVEFVQHDDAHRFGPADAERYKTHLIESEYAPGTIREKRAKLHTLFECAIRNSSRTGITANPMSGFRYKVKKSRPVVFYDVPMAQRVLTVARSQDSNLKWLIFVLAYTGARINEVASLRIADVRKLHDEWVIDIRNTKTDDRAVPLPPALIQEGFIDWVANLNRSKDSHVFELTGGKYNRPGKNAGDLIGKFVRQLGITSSEVRQPAHGFRHFFIAWCEGDLTIPERVVRGLIGHAGADVHQRYGKAWISTMAAAVKKIPALV